MNKYAEEFISFKCSGDILNVVNPIGSGFEKEVSESMMIWKRMKPYILHNKMKYNILDLCAGNPITSILSVFTLPVAYAVAVDKRKVNRRYGMVKRFDYREMDIYSDKIYELINENTIIVSVHCCTSLADRVVEIYNKSKANSVYMSPCCIGEFEMLNKQFLRDNIGKYLTWSLYLAGKANGKLYKDKYCISPKNALIVGHKGGYECLEY